MNYLTQEEYTTLIREAVDGEMVAARFGPGWVALDDIPENEWARQLLIAMRRKANADPRSAEPAEK